MGQFPHLFSPGRIGTLELKNRLCQTAMGSTMAEPDGTCGDRLVAYHEARAAGGVALITTEAVSVGHPNGMVILPQLGISEDRFIPGLRRLTDAVHRHDAKMAVQLHFGGTMSVGDMLAGRPLWCASTPRPGRAVGFNDILFPEEIALDALAKITEPVTLKEMDQADIARLIGWFADGAERAVKCGFDAVEIHCGHGYIIANFLSPSTNRRTDGYGGSPENRARLLKEVTQAVRARVEPDFPVWCKIDAAEFYVEDGSSIADVCLYAQIAEAAGANAITATANHNYAVPGALLSSWLPHEPAKLIPYAAAIKAAVGVPVITVGRIDPDRADRAIAAGEFDFMAMGRKQLADPNYAKTLASAGAEAVRPCIYCYTCLSQSMLQQPLRCSVNGDLGFETQNLLAPTTKPRRIVVVGGGPGGMETARRLMLRGHQVVLLEKSAQLGGTARLAAIAYAPNSDFVEWLKARLAEAQVDVRLGVTASVDRIGALEPDAVVVATGAVRRAPPIKGKELPHVHDGESLRGMLLGEEAGASAKAPLGQRLVMGAARGLGLTSNPDLVRKASKLWMPLGDRVVIIGGDLVGLELAEFLHERGRQVAVVDEADKFGRGLAAARRSVMLEELPAAGVALHPGVRDIAIGETDVRFTDKTGEARELAADSVIIAKGAEADTGLYDDLVAAGFEAHMVGDCQGVGYIVGAVRNAADVAARL